MNNNNKNHVKVKVSDLVQEFVALELQNGAEIPPNISDYLLKNFGWTGECSGSSENDADDFVERLEDFITDRYQSSYEKNDKTDELTRASAVFLEMVDKLENTKSEFFQTNMQIITTLVDLTVLKAKYSIHLKNKSSMELLKVIDLEKRLEVLKLQSLSKLYGESNGYEALVILQQILDKEKRQLELMHDKLVQQEVDYEKLKDNQEFYRLLKTYKELLKQEKILNAMNDV